MARESLSWTGLLSIGSGSALVLAAGFGLGWWIDDLAQTSPVFVLIGIALGMFGASAYVVTEIRKFLND